ncbi:MAG: hypothetical protein JXQ81_08860 [Desulfuromonadales bacterium]|nr:hypothetical protein [Desulfuromonadales bacterium]MBN2792601.1 hypothetical protein [Desulfuromonadales bacterium]
MKNTVRNLILALICFATAVSVASAATQTGSQGGSLLLTLFIGFFALIVVFQLVPACILFVGMVKGLFSREQKSEEKQSHI